MHTIFSKIDKKYKIEYWLLLGMNIISTGILTFNVYLEGILLNSLVYKADRAAFVRSIVLITTLSLIRLLLPILWPKLKQFFEHPDKQTTYLQMIKYLSTRGAS